MQVRQLYVSQILILQQDQVSRDTPDEQGFVDLIITRHDRQMATQHAQLTAQREKEVAELTERHKQQMQDMIRRHDLESAKWATYIPSRWIVGLDVSAHKCSHPVHVTNEETAYLFNDIGGLRRTRSPETAELYYGTYWLWSQYRIQT